MVFNPLALLTPQQREQLARTQQITKNVKYIVHTEDSENRVEVTLETDDPDAAQLLPQIMEGIVSSVTQMLYQMFDMKGERV
jgi:hypothetical protein